MQHEVKKITVIINELISIMLLNGAEDIDMSIKRKSKTTEVTIIHRNCQYTDEFIKDMRYNLNAGKQSEVEGYYWQLVGEDETSEELYLVGAMIDEAKLEMKQNDLHIYILRNA